MFLNTYNGEKIIFHGSVEYIFYKKSLLRIKKNIPDAKFILILRNPLDRLISAYNSWKKLQVEDENNILIASIDKRLERSSSDDDNIKSKLTYIDHGLYSRQLETLYSLFNKNQIFICFFEDLKSNPKDLIKALYTFLEIDNEFLPKFNSINRTGSGLKSVFLEKIFSKSISLHSSLRRFVVDKIIDRFFSLNKRNKLKWRIREWNSIKHKNAELKTNISHKERKELLTYFISDIEKLEQMLQINLDHWKKVN